MDLSSVLRKSHLAGFRGVPRTGAQRDVSLRESNGYECAKGLTRACLALWLMQKADDTAMSVFSI